MKIKVEHEVAFSEGKETTCYASDEGRGWHTMCQYLRERDRMHGRKAPIEHKVPKCILFNEWLTKSGLYPDKCSQCKKACGITENKTDLEKAIEEVEFYQKRPLK